MSCDVSRLSGWLNTPADSKREFMEVVALVSKLSPWPPLSNDAAEKNIASMLLTAPVAQPVMSSLKFERLSHSAVKSEPALATSHVLTAPYVPAAVDGSASHAARAPLSSASLIGMKAFAPGASSAHARQQAARRPMPGSSSERAMEGAATGPAFRCEPLEAEPDCEKNGPWRVGSRACRRDCISQHARRGVASESRK